MSKGRIEAFSDGVIAIIITIMVLELHAPHGDTFADLRAILPVFISYTLSFIYVGIYWNNHHHMFQAVQRVSGGALWANLHLLFWLSLIPFTTNWLGEHFSAQPVALYGINLFLAGFAYHILARILVHHHGKDSRLALALGSDFKGKLSVALYAIAIPIAFFAPKLAFAIYVAVAAIWFIPDRRMEGALARE